MSRSAARRRRACAAARTFSRSITSSCIGSEMERVARARVESAKRRALLFPPPLALSAAASRAPLAQLLPRFRPAEPGAALAVLHEIERQAPGPGAQGQSDLLLLRAAPSPARERGLSHRGVGDDVPRPGACSRPRRRARRGGVGGEVGGWGLRSVSLSWGMRAGRSGAVERSARFGSRHARLRGRGASPSRRRPRRRTARSAACTRRSRRSTTRRRARARSTSRCSTACAGSQRR